MQEAVNRVWVRVASLGEFDASRRLVCEVEGMSVLMQRLGNEVVAVLNVCTHLGKPLDQGRVVAGQIICPYHGACFDLRTGAAVSGPAVSSLHRFPTRLENSEVFVDLGARPTAIVGKPFKP